MGRFLRILAKVIPILKPGKQPTNYASFRPISLLSCVGKLFEKMIHKRLDWFLETKKIYPEEMNGFRQNRSAIDNVIALISSVEEELACGNTPTALFLDIKAAYDSVYHKAILEALETLGLGGRLYAWIADYLQGRQLFTCTPEGPTTFHAVEKGVPQGAVLSPVLFNLALIHLKRNLPRGVSITLYADDICIWSAARSRRNTQQRLQRALANISAYLNSRGLKLSPDKSVAMAFSRRRMEK